MTATRLRVTAYGMAEMAPVTASVRRERGAVPTMTSTKRPSRASNSSVPQHLDVDLRDRVVEQRTLIEQLRDDVTRLSDELISRDIELGRALTGSQQVTCPRRIEIACTIAAWFSAFADS